MKYATQLSVGRFGTKSWRARCPYHLPLRRCEGPERIRGATSNVAVFAQIPGDTGLDDETRCEGPARISLTRDWPSAWVEAGRRETG